MERSAKKAQENRRKRVKDNYANRGGTLNRNQFNKIKQVSKRRYVEGIEYSQLRKVFLEQHPICPVTGEKTEQIHHSAHREGAWLNLRRYWIAVSRKGHKYIHNNAAWAYENNLLLKVNALYDAHCQALVDSGLSLDEPVFYETWSEKPLLTQ